MFLALAAFALMFQATVPQGFMLGGNAKAPALVICTGHGPLLSQTGRGKPVKAPTSKADMACAFAGHGAAAGTLDSSPAISMTFAAPPMGAGPVVTAWPGLGLAAPPPPSHAPPIV